MVWSETSVSAAKWHLQRQKKGTRGTKTYSFSFSLRVSIPHTIRRRALVERETGLSGLDTLQQRNYHLCSQGGTLLSSGSKVSKWLKWLKDIGHSKSSCAVYGTVFVQHISWQCEGPDHSFHCYAPIGAQCVDVWFIYVSVEATQNTDRSFSYIHQNACVCPSRTSFCS